MGELTAILRIFWISCPASPEAGLFFKPQRAQSSQRKFLATVQNRDD
jgi:hypothetical protein